MADLQVNETSYALAADATFEQWMEHGRTLLGIMRAVSWWVGDWIIAGEQRFGEVYAQAVDLTGLSESALRQAAWVASRIPPEERHPSLSFAHHRAVAALEPAERKDLLDTAAEQALTERDLRALVKARRDPDLAREPVVPEETPLPERVRVAIRLLEQAQRQADWALVDDALNVLRTGL